MKIVKVLKFTGKCIASVAGISFVAYQLHKQDYINNKPVKEGSNSRRDFYRLDGIPKKAYDNPYDAKRAAIDSMTRSGESFNPYMRADGLYSIGHGQDGDNWPFVALGKINRFLQQ